MADTTDVSGLAGQGVGSRFGQLQRALRGPRPVTGPFQAFEEAQPGPAQWVLFGRAPNPQDQRENQQAGQAGDDDEQHDQAARRQAVDAQRFEQLRLAVGPILDDPVVPALLNDLPS